MLSPASYGQRGVAILLVIINHFGSSLGFPGFTDPALGFSRVGWCGVGVAFVLSGFRMTAVLLDTKSALDCVRNFCAGRVVRMVPLYYGTFFVVLPPCLAPPNLGGRGLHDGLSSSGSLLWSRRYLRNFGVCLQDRRFRT